MKVAATIVLILLLIAGALWGLGYLFGGHSSHSRERSPRESLRTLAVAEADYRVNDRDGNGKLDFWREDVSSLWAMIPKGGTSGRDMIKLIELSVAGADDRPLPGIETFIVRQSKAGYWFRAIRKRGEPPVLSESQFAFCAFPAVYGGSSRATYIIDEGNTVFKADLGHGRGIEVFPDDDELRRSWAKMD